MKKVTFYYNDLFPELKSDDVWCQSYEEKALKYIT